MKHIVLMIALWHLKIYQGLNFHLLSLSSQWIFLNTGLNLDTYVASILFKFENTKSKYIPMDS